MKTGKTISVILILFCLMACRSDGVRVNVTFDELSGLVKDDRVLYQGNTAGHVKQVQLNKDGTYTVQIQINESFVNSATEYSQFHFVDDADRPGRKGIAVVMGKKGGKPLPNGATVAGVPPRKDLATRLQKDLAAGIGFLKKQIEGIGQDVEAIPDSQEYKDFKKALEDLAAEFKLKEKEAREKIKRHWIPKLQRELDELRKELERQGREDELAPLERKLEEIYNI